MIILSIPFISTDFVQKKFHRYSPNFDLIEFRLDYNQNIENFPSEFIDQRTIITIRDKSEGGKYEIRYEEKINFYRNVIKNYNCLVDIEIEQLQSEYIQAENLILSRHFPSKTDFSQIHKIIKLSNSLPAKYLKLAVNIEKYSDLTELKKLFSESNKPVIFAGLGKLGKTSRILYKKLNSIGTFVGLNEHRTAKEQLTIAEAEKSDLSRLDKTTKIGGIIGRKQVKKSIGITFYNNYFRKKKLQAVYLPFPVEDLSDFHKWILSWKEDFFGFSITMPFKKDILKWRENDVFERIKKQDSELRKNMLNLNLYIPNVNIFLNTDLIAFQKSFIYLEIKNNEKILIVGNGGVAETALFSLQEFSEIYLTARNKIAGTELCSDNNCRFVSLEKLKLYKFDLIINCTPIGMNNENLLTMIDRELPAKIIDLAYTEKKTPLIEICEKKKIPFVDGKMFWKWQSEKQLEMFLEAINGFYN